MCSEEEAMTGNIISIHEINLSMFSDVEYCYSLLEAIPLPGPTWSTTAPCVLANPPSYSSAPPIEGSSELEWGSENQASSYTWWLGFLQSLDEKLNLPPYGGKKNAGMENAKLISLEPSFVDDWLMIPTLEKDLEDMVVIP